ncbi:hypothetical protein MNB_SV-5-1196 [hydrothermal vent metagenome]|uniref:Lipoprotein n=1 Tax=hydrothermal vent metagenome TaxID=652676 RepID=A0A1W1EDG7_9ZZZZ
MKKTLLLSSLLTITLIFTGCTDKEKSKSLTEGGMKCGAGKCGSSMVDGSAVLVKKKLNILNQLDKNDSRRDCVLKANSTKVLYDCVRVNDTGRLSSKCSAEKTIDKKVPKKISNDMKCSSGKCNGSM